MLKIGIQGYDEKIVTEELTASHIGSGAPRVFATAMMIAMMENACRQSVKPYLDEGQETVGTYVDVSHESATPVGMKVWSKTSLVEINERRLKFEVEAYDECGLIGKGFHYRFIIDEDRFARKTLAKLDKINANATSSIV